MKDRGILIRNIYVMLAYAFRAMRSSGTDRLATQEFSHLHDLLAEILSSGVATQIKRGVHRDYIARAEALTTVRGRIDVTRSIATHSLSRGRLACEFDEYEIDTPHNQAVKSVIILLLRHGEVSPARKDKLRRILPHLEEVTLVAPTSIRWDALTYHRANASYRLLLGVCELVVRGLLHTEKDGAAKLSTWVADDAMSMLYERFLREYFVFHHPELSPGSPTVRWDLDQPSLISGQLPEMRTDLTLRHQGRALIIDAKYYGKTLQEGWSGKQTVHSGNLYQILTYVKNEDRNQDGSIAGILLYARTDSDAQPDLDVAIQGNRIGAQTIDLNQPWESIANRLESLLTWIGYAPSEALAS